MSKPETTITAIAPIAAPTSALTLPADGTTERARFRQEAADMSEVLIAAEANPRAIVLWHGVPRVVADLVRAWRKEAQAAEHKRLDAYRTPAPANTSAK